MNSSAQTESRGVAKPLRRVLGTLLGLGVFSFLLAAVLLCPLPLTRVDKQRILVETARSLANGTPVRQLVEPRFDDKPATIELQPIIDGGFIQQDGKQWRLKNGTDLDLSELLEAGYRMFDADELEGAPMNDWYAKNTLVSVSTAGLHGGDQELRISYRFGSLGGHGYRIRAYRCLLGLWYYCEHEWVS